MGPDSLTLWLFGVKVMLYASSLIAAGISLHLGLGVIEAEGRRRAALFVTVAAFGAMLLTAARLFVINAQLGDGVSAALDYENFAWTWRAQGAFSMALLGGSVAILLAVSLKLPWLGIAGSLGVALSFGLTGHSLALNPPGLAPWSVALHVLIAAFWFAAPFSLWPSKSLSNSALLARLEHFSKVALIAIPVLFGLGVWLALRLSGGIAQLVPSAYGKALLIKLIVAGIALGLGGVNKFMTTPIVAKDPVRGRRLLMRSLSIEATAFGGALSLVGWATTMIGPPNG